MRKQQKRAAAGDSIEKRPEEIGQREEFGHWEMDSVIGKRGVSKNVLLVLTERKTRDEIIFKLPDHTDEAVIAALDRFGTNEVTNKMVRRKVPKGTSFDNKTDEEIGEIENWINGYPRRIHGCRSAGELFTEELEKLA